MTAFAHAADAAKASAAETMHAVPASATDAQPATAPDGPAAVQRLQGALGNAATARLIGGRRGTSARRALQRQVVTRLVIQDMDGHGDWMVWDVVLGGRTPSPFRGTMGAHSTAWVAHLDEVRRAVVNRPLLHAADQLLTLASSKIDEDLDSLYELRTNLSAAHEKVLETAKGAAQSAIDALDVLIAIEPPDIVAVQAGMRRLIDRYLTFVNYLPAATVKGGDPAGHGEGSARGEVTYFEYVCALAKRKASGETDYTRGEDPFLTQAAKGLPTWLKAAYDAGFDPARCASTRERMIKNLWAMFAAETPGIFIQTSRADPARVWRLVLKNFLETISRAYPYSYAFTEMHEPAIQRLGLAWAMQEAGVAWDPSVDSPIGDTLDVRAATRQTSEYAEVADSDIVRGGSGFRVLVLLAEPDESDPTAERAIVEVEMIGRTQSPFSGTMGAHSTAWIAHLDALANLLRAKTLGDAIAALIARAQAGLADPSLKYAHLLDEKHRSYLLIAYNDLRSAAGAAPAPTAAEIQRLQFLEAMIVTYMTYLNFLPMSTVATGAVPGGRTEGRIRKQLLSYEEFGIQAMTPEQRRDRRRVLSGWLEQLYDAAALEHFPPDLIDFDPPAWTDPAYQYSRTHPLWTAFAKRGTQAPDKDLLARQRFYRTLMEAYPRCMVDSGLVTAPEHEASKAVDLPQQVERDRPQLEAMLRQNNCLIHAIADAAQITLTYQHLREIRLRIGEVGTMLIASPRTINIICSVLRIAGVVVVYPDPLPSEEFGDQTRPVIVQHTGAQHFVPFAGAYKRKSRSDQHDPLARPDSDPSERKRARPAPPVTTPP